MTLVSVPLITYPAIHTFVAYQFNAARADLRLDATNTKQACIFSVPYSGTIDKVVWSTGTVTDGAKDVDLVLETLSSGNPSGSAYGSCAVGTQSDNQASNTAYETTLGTSCTATAGDLVACVWSWNGGTAGDIYLQQCNAGGSLVLPCQAYYASAAWTKGATYVPGLGLHYTDSGGFYAPVAPIPPAVGATYNAVAANDNPDEYGLSFTPPFKCRAIGAWYYAGSADTSAALTAILYEGTTARATHTLAAGVPPTTTYHRHFGMFAAPYTLAAGTTYVLANKSTVDDHDFRLYYATVMSGKQGVYGLPAGAGLVTRADTGAWSAVDQTMVPLIGLIVDQVDDGTGTGGSSPRIGSYNGGVS